jgi:DNA-binding Lrp family transcriptional regulator
VWHMRTTDPLYGRIDRYLEDAPWGYSYRELAERFDTKEDQVRRAVRRLKKDGRAKTEPDWRIGHPDPAWRIEPKRGQRPVRVYATPRAWEKRTKDRIKACKSDPTFILARQILRERHGVDIKAGGF